MIKTQSRNKIISSLYREFKKLEKGKDIVIKLQLPTAFINANISWQSAREPELSYDDNIFGCIEKFDLDKFINKECDKSLKTFQKEINNFIKKCDNYARQLGEDEHDFFHRMMDYGIQKQNKINAKKILKKQFTETSEKLHKLKQQLQEL